MKNFLILISLGIFLGSGNCTHFYGGSITWKAMDPNRINDVGALIQWRFFWRSTFSANHFCNDTKIVNGDLIGDSGFINCEVGCSPTTFRIDSKVTCSDYSLSDNWSGGQRSTQISFPNQTYIEGVFKGSAWLKLVTGGGSWELRFRMNLIQRADTRKINTPPTCLVKPITIMRAGCENTLKIFTTDPDGDTVRCRWSNSSLKECGSICSAVPGAVLDEEKCILKFSPNITGYYAVSIQVEDFAEKTSKLALSSIPVQFLIKSEKLSCIVNKLEFQDPTFKDDSCVFVKFNGTFHSKIIVLSTSRLVEISTLSPRGLIKSKIDNYNNDQNLWYVNLTWTVTDPDQIGVNLFCFEAINVFDEKSDQRCVSLVVDGKGPIFEQPFPTGLVDPIVPFFSVKSSNVPIIKSISPSSYIRIFDSKNAQIAQLESVSSNVQVTDSRTLTFRLHFNFTRGESYFILFDANVAQSNQSCPLESLPIDDKKFWVFTVKISTTISTSTISSTTTTLKTTSTNPTTFTLSTKKITSTIKAVSSTKTKNPSTTLKTSISSSKILTSKLNTKSESTNSEEKEDETALNEYNKKQTSSLIKFFQDFTEKALVGFLATIGGAVGLVSMLAVTTVGIGLVVRKLKKKPKILPNNKFNSGSNKKFFSKSNAKRPKFNRKDSDMSICEDVDSDVESVCNQSVQEENSFNNSELRGQNDFGPQKFERNTNRMDFRTNPENYDINRSNHFGYQSISVKPKNTGFVIKR
ncbi:integrin beta A [Brachionus plicatilis]|uniref:Integrin beta A n=1 Tax=Brachionus plicatilis TaxID=10195 RepID=A0A3M7S6H0_BRAPC|nr:integrin beta A [Brachionus plicatilis]